MCELFGASASKARGYSSWLTPFRTRGGGTADNPDGWGLAWWQAGAARIEKAPEPGHRSERMRQLAQDVSGDLVLAHVRKATHPAVPGASNTHPFAHACCGREWIFAHNGMVPDIVGRPCRLDTCRPEGETDSEFAFCQLLAGIVDSYDPADPDHWLGRLEARTSEIALFGKFNFLLSDGSILVAHGHDRLHHAERADGLALVATEPLDAGDWHPFAPGELRVYRDGALLAGYAP
ncbi:MAG: class II glutamine amidotransferase [Rhodocyclales bacterium]|nr:class II glutamine amidotransferase [Rhodocyclales bacterium]